MKRFKNILLLVLIVFLFSACGKSSNLKEMSYSDFQKKLKSNDTFFFVVVKDGCSFCENYEPKLEEVLDEYDVIGYKLNLTDLTEQEYKEFMTKYNVSGTPNTIFIENGSEVSIMQRIDGDASKSVIIEKLKSKDYIK